MSLPTEDEWRGMIPQIARIAETVGRRANASPTVRDELESAAVAHVHGRIAAFDRSRGSFAAWCQTVLRNHCISLIRSEAVQRKRGHRHAEQSAREYDQRLHDDPPPSALEIAEEQAAESRRPRLDVVDVLERHLQPIDRVLVAVYAGICTACGDETVARWCRDAGGVDPAALPAIEALPKGQRKQGLAMLLGEKLAWVRQRIFRAVVRLKKSGIGGSGT